MTTSPPYKAPRCFAPLDSSRQNKQNAPKLKGVVFDVDGTLCLPQNYMFKEMRSALGIPKSVDIIEHMNTLSDKPDAEGDSGSSPLSRAQEAIKQIERDAMQHQQPQPGLNELVTRLTQHNVRLALCTRNFETPVNHLLEKFVSEEGRKQFSPLITRETKGIRAKPSPEGIWACVQAWNRSKTTTQASGDHGNTHRLELSEEENTRACEGVIMVGDSIDDIVAGARAGAATVLLVNDENKHLLEATEWPERVDVGIKRLDELADVLENGFCGKQ